MKRESTDNQNESTESPWPGVLWITGEEFQQSFAVAELAVKLWETKMANVAVPLQKGKVRDNGPTEFLKEAWELIQRAHKHVSRPQTEADYLAQHGGCHEAAEKVIGRTLQQSRIPSRKLCDEKPEHESVTIHGVKWTVYTSERAFDNLFWAYWRNTSILRLRTIVSRVEVLGNEGDRWEEYGKQMLVSWKKDGVPPNDFLAIAKFRKERDNRSENLKKNRNRSLGG